MTANGVESTCRFSGSRPMSLSVPSTIPWSARMNCQLRIRITNETKNGSSRSSSSADLWRPPRKAIQ